MSSSNEKYHAKFVIEPTQASSLTMNTPLQITKSLSRIYPFLLIVDNILNHLLWVSNDPQLTFLNLVSLILGLRYLLVPVPLKDTSFSMESLIMNLFGLLCIQFQMTSVAFYVYSVYEDLNSYEPPTLDDIVLLLENISVKLELMKNDYLSLIRIDNFSAFLKWTIFLTPFQMLIFKFKVLYFIKDYREYTIFFVALAFCFHSIRFQSTLKLIWRLIYLRMLYFWWQGTTDPLYTDLTIDADRYFNLRLFKNDYKTVELIIDDVLELTDVNILKNKLREISDNPIEKGLAEDLSIKFNIMEVKIYESERKWGNDAWLPKLLPYERSNFVTYDSEKTNYICHKPVNFETHLPKGWFLLNDDWNVTEWVYYNSNWEETGSKDTLEAYSRSRLWETKIFQKQPSKSSL